MAIWDIFGALVLYGHLVFWGNFGSFLTFGLLYQEKSGNPALKSAMSCQDLGLRS
jgi:hypothetical protein